MIDEKKLDAAAYKFATSQTHGELLALIDGYKEGFKDAINEFLKNLWHPAKEKPKKNSIILAKIILYRIILSPEGSKEDVCRYIYQVIEFNKRKKYSISELEKEYQCNLKVIEWLYIDDLFKKEGGAQ